MSMKQPGKSAALTPQTTLIVIAVFLLASVGVVMAVVKMAGSSGNAVTAVARPSLPAPATTGATHADVAGELTREAQNYTVVVSRNLFQAQGGAAVVTKPKPAPTPSPPPIIVPVFVNTPTVQAPTVAFTGVVEIAGDKYALLENLLDHHAQYTRVGSEAFGYTLKSIDGRSVTLVMDGTSMLLNMGDNKVSEKTTPPVTAAPQTPAVAGDGAGGTTPNTPGGMTPGTGTPGAGNFPGGFRNRRRQQNGQLPGEG